MLISCSGAAITTLPASAVDASAETSPGPIAMMPEAHESPRTMPILGCYLRTIPVLSVSIGPLAEMRILPTGEAV